MKSTKLQRSLDKARGKTLVENGMVHLMEYYKNMIHLSLKTAVIGHIDQPECFFLREKSLHFPEN